MTSVPAGASGDDTVTGVSTVSPGCRGRCRACRADWAEAVVDHLGDLGRTVVVQHGGGPVAGDPLRVADQAAAERGRPMARLPPASNAMLILRLCCVRTSDDGTAGGPRPAAGSGPAGGSVLARGAHDDHGARGVVHARHGHRPQDQAR